MAHPARPMQQPQVEAQQPPSKFARILSASAIGYLACRIFSTINPITAAIFNGAAELTNMVTSRIFHNSRLNPFDRALLSNGVSIAAGYYITNYFAKITLIEAVKVSVLTIISQVAFAVLFGATVLLGGLAIFALGSAAELAARRRA